MLPLNPLRLPRLIEELPLVPGWRLPEDGDAAIEKSMKVKVTTAFCVRDPLVPVIVTV